MKLQEKYDKILEYFRETQPIVESELHFSNSYELLVAVVLSAQCTDKRVNMITPALFKAYPTPQAMSEAEDFEVLEYVKSVSYPNAKARHLVELARMLVTEFNGEIPQTMEELTRLPGVGRKTANVMMAVAFGKSAMPVDTHVFRVSHRLKLVPASCNTPLKVEKALMKHIPANDAANAHHWLLLHGRYICKSQRPLCEKCPFNSFCTNRM